MPTYPSSFRCAFCAVERETERELPRGWFFLESTDDVRRHVCGGRLWFAVYTTRTLT
jgi:hypothetical protein